MGLIFKVVLGPFLGIHVEITGSDQEGTYMQTESPVEAYVHSLHGWEAQALL